MLMEKGIGNGASRKHKGIAMAASHFVRDVEDALGESIDTIRSVPLSDRRMKMENIAGRPMRVVSHHPLIGRGSVLGDRGVTHQEAEAAYGRAVHTPWYDHIRWLWIRLRHRAP